MKINELIKSSDNLRISAKLKNFTIKGISCNSKNILNGYIFVAIKGSRENGNKFIDEAIKNGARLIISQDLKGIPKKTKGAYFIKVNDARKVLADLASNFYDCPSSKLKVVGITGTNGKTTISYLIEAILKEANFNPAVIGTINYHFKNRVLPSKNTTPGPVELQSMLATMLKESVNYVITEVSSHALDQNRIGGIDFHSAIFTNLTQDHLDYHKTIEGYFKAKAKLFKNLSPKATAVLNIDDKYGLRLKRMTRAKIITYAIENKADVCAQNLRFGVSDTEFVLTAKRIKTVIKANLVGKHNVYNVLAAVSWALKEGIDIAVVRRALEKLFSVPGRLEKVDSVADFSIFVDYAHTEDALKNAISSLRSLSKNRIIVVFGCGGERDKTKRPKMGRVVSRLSDYFIITNDNPRSENPAEIIRDIRRGIKKDNYCVIPERKGAIRKSLSLARSGDIILVAGKGHENCQVLKNKTIHFDDREVIRECLRSKN